MNVEDRVRKLEEITIKIEALLEGWLAKSQDDRNTTSKQVSANTKDITDLKTAMFQSCDAKTHEIDEKVAKAMSKVWSVITLLFGMFIGAVYYFNMMDATIHEKVNSYEIQSARKESSADATLRAVLEEVRYIRSKVDEHNTHRDK